MASESEPSPEFSWPSLRLGRPGGGGGCGSERAEGVDCESDINEDVDGCCGVCDESDDEFVEDEGSDSLRAVREGRLGGIIALIIVKGGSGSRLRYQMVDVICIESDEVS